MFICAICISSLGRAPGFLSIVNWIVCSLVVVFYECFVYFEYQSYQICILQVFFPRAAFVELETVLFLPKRHYTTYIGQ